MKLLSKNSVLRRRIWYTAGRLKCMGIPFKYPTAMAFVLILSKEFSNNFEFNLRFGLLEISILNLNIECFTSDFYSE